MRILIADDSVAQSKGLRELFGRLRSTLKSRKSIHRSSALKLEEILVSCPGVSSGKNDDCACHGLDLADQPEQAASILDALGIALLNRGCADEGGRLIEQALRIRRKLYGDDHPVTAASLHSYARLLRERGEYADAERTADVALQINRAAALPASLPVAISLYELGVIYLNQGRFGDAASAAKEALSILATLELDDTDPYQTRLMDVLARAEAGLGRPEESATIFKALLKLDQAQVGNEHPKYATHLGNYAVVRETLGEVRAAEKDLRRVIEIYRKILNRKCHPNLIDAYANLGSLLRARNAGSDIREAGGYFREALRLGEMTRGRRHFLVAIDHSNLGRWQYDIADSKGALTSFSTAIRILNLNVARKTIDPENIFIAESLTWLGRTLVESSSVRDAVRAETPLERALTIWSSQSQPEPAGEAITQASLGRSLFLQDKDLLRALHLLEEAYPVVLKFCGASHPLTLRAEKWLNDARGSAAGKSRSSPPAKRARK